MEPSKQFVVRHEAKHSAVKNGTRNTGHGIIYDANSLTLRG
ncbi:MAG: hypothetical protein N2381_11170 [Armatimonadetes bacterium]|nr:hypothetical protein [Armatimonadota bacterium]